MDIIQFLLDAIDFMEWYAPVALSSGGVLLVVGLWLISDGFKPSDTHNA